MSDRDQDKLDQIQEKLSDIRAELVAIRVDVNYHIHRTNLLEERFEKLDKDMTKFQGFFTVGGWIVGVAATIITMLNLLGLI